MEEKEIWKDVKGYEGYYQVSNLGRIKSLPRLMRNKNGMSMLKGRFIKHGIDTKGYHQVKLSRNRKQKQFSVHRLVYESFKGEIPTDLQVNHIDENKDNNAISNLNLMTAKENINWGSRTYRAIKKIEKKVIMDDNIEFSSIRKAADYLKCSRTSVSMCCRKLINTACGHHFKYK